MKNYSLRKSRQIMKAAYAWYEQKGKTLSPEKLSLFESHLQLLDQALMNGDREQANTYAHKVEEFCSDHFTKSIWMHTKELGIALVFALIVAVIVRQMWFELYEIPTGSMRPTYQEQDHLTVSKTQFGLNIPLMPGHFYFNKDLVERTGVVIFLGDNLPIDDGTAYYFNVVPYSKRFIKRLIAKPGDTVYFYGGKIYGIDKDGTSLNEYAQPWMQPLEHIPVLNFNGRATLEGNQMVISQMHLPVGRVTATPFGIKSEVNNGSQWVTDKPTAQPHDHVQTYSDLWGIGNFAMARLLTREQLQNYPINEVRDLEEAPLYVELIHHPVLDAPMRTSKSIIPLQQKHLDALRQHLYTTRFVVEGGHAHNYNVNGERAGRNDPAFPGVPDGVYQIDKGRVQQVGFGGVLYDVPADHPLYKNDPKLIQKLFNLGIEFNYAFLPLPQNPFPNRYAYFRDGDLYLLGAPIISKEDPALISFNQREKQKQEKGNYIAFADQGAPKDKQFIETFGLKIPEGYYLVLGDNHAVSADSRVMGFIPEANLQGTPDILLWPPGNRWLAPEATPYKLFTCPRIFVWMIAGIIAAICYGYYRYKIKKPIFKKL